MAGMGEGYMVRDGLRTWYEVVGDLAGDSTPLVLCHGGPGLTSDYLTTVAQRLSVGRPCIRYDQLGGGRSDRPAVDSRYWTVELFVRELEALTEHLGIADGYQLLGHSWGGMLALELAARRPTGLRSLVVADAFASSATYVRHVTDLVRELPSRTRAMIERHEAAGTTESAEYQEAMRFFFGRHVCRCRPVPNELMRTLEELATNATVYHAMSGPSEFTMTGSLRDWDVTASLAKIDVPVLLVSGRYDEVAPPAVEELYRGLPDATWVLFEESSHMPHLEEPDRFVEVVSGFLARCHVHARRDQ